MPNTFDLTDEMQNYFNSLPKNIQQELVLSDASINSLVDMKAVVDALTGDCDEEKTQN